MLKINEIYNEDCLETMDNIPAMKIDLIIADPPYNFTTASAGSGKLNPMADLWNSAYWYSAWIKKGLKALKIDGAMWSFCNWRSIVTITKAVFDVGRQIESLLIWDKGCIGTGGTKGLRPSYEMVALIANEKFSIKDRGIPDIKTVKWSSTKPTGHPTEKPVELIEWLIEISGKKLIYDPFMGSGTTAIACIKNGNEYIGSELSAEYCKMAQKRIKAEMQKISLF